MRTSKTVWFMRFAAIFPLLMSGVIRAAEIQPFPKSDMRRSIELVQQYLDAPGYAQTKLWAELQELNPKGPAFVDEALKLIAANRVKWKSFSDPRSSMLFLVDRAIRESLPWKDFPQSELKNSIHASAQSLLQILANTSRHQDSLLTIFDLLELWDSTDLRFLIQKSYSGGVSSRYFPRLIENFKNASLEDKQYILDRTRKQSRRELAHYALAYQTGLMEQKDYTWLLRLFMDDGDSLRRISSLRDPYAFGARHGLGTLGSLNETEIFARNKNAVDGLIGDVLRDLHTRLRSEDPLIKAAYDDLLENRSWPGLRLTEEDKAAHLDFLRGLYTGSVISECTEKLTSVEKDNLGD